jgi:uncharacterized membrane protein YkgB
VARPPKQFSLGLSLRFFSLAIVLIWTTSVSFQPFIYFAVVAQNPHVSFKKKNTKNEQFLVLTVFSQVK